MSVLTLDRLGNCALLTMNWPQSLNAITTEMLDLLEQHPDTIEPESEDCLERVMAFLEKRPPNWKDR